MCVPEHTPCDPDLGLRTITPTPDWSPALRDLLGTWGESLALQGPVSPRGTPRTGAGGGCPAEVAAWPRTGLPLRPGAQGLGVIALNPSAAWGDGSCPPYPQVNRGPERVGDSLQNSVNSNVGLSGSKAGLSQGSLRPPLVLFVSRPLCVLCRWGLRLPLPPPAAPVLLFSGAAQRLLACLGLLLGWFCF